MKIAVFTALALVGAIVAGSPALSQPDRPQPDRDHGYGHFGPGWEDHGTQGWDLQRRLDWMQERITRGRDDGSLSWREARRAQARLDDIRQDMRRMRYRSGGWLRPEDRDALQARLDRLNDQIRWMRHNDEARPW